MNKNWQTKRLGEVIILEYGKPLPKSQRKQDGLYPVYGANGEKTRTDSYFYEKPSIIVGRKGSAGEINYTEDKFWPLDVTYFVTFDENTYDLKFLYNLLVFSDLQDLAKGVKPGINRNDVYNISVKVPPLPTQYRIVKILDEIFANIEITKANTKNNLKNSRELFESYVQNVFVNAGKNWEEVKLGTLTTKIGSGATPRGGKKSYKGEGISLVRSMNVHDRHFTEHKLAFIDDLQAHDLNNVTLEKDDVLLNITGASVARCCVFPEKHLPGRVNQHVSIIRPLAEIISPFFLCYLLTSKFYKDQLLAIGEQGATRQAITKAQIEDFIIKFPRSLTEQQSIVTHLDTLSTHTKQLEVNYQKKLNALEELKKSVLQKAFQGELI